MQKSLCVRTKCNPRLFDMLRLNFCIAICCTLIVIPALWVELPGQIVPVPWLRPLVRSGWGFCQLPGRAPARDEDVGHLGSHGGDVRGIRRHGSRHSPGMLPVSRYTLKMILLLLEPPPAGRVAISLCRSLEDREIASLCQSLEGAGDTKLSCL